MEESILIDDYSKYCFDILKRSCPQYLKDIGFETEESIANLNKKDIHVKNTSNNDIHCKYCNSNNIVQRSVQMRSSDEGETLVTYCNECKKTF